MESYSAKSDNPSAQNTPEGAPVVEDRCVLGQVVIERLRTAGGYINYSYCLNDPDARLNQNDIMFLEELMVLAMLGESRERRRREQEQLGGDVEISKEQITEAYNSYTKFWEMEVHHAVREAADKLLGTDVITKAPSVHDLPPDIQWEKEVKPNSAGKSRPTRFVSIEASEGDHLPANVEPETTFETVPGEMLGDPPPRKECKQRDLDKELLEQQAKDRATTWTGTGTLREIEDKELGKEFLSVVDVGNDDCIKKETWRDRPPLL